MSTKLKMSRELERRQLVEKLCAAVAEWLSEEAHSISYGGCSELWNAAREATNTNGGGEHLAILLDAALGEVQP
jgi:hypothetical protein